MQRSQRQKDRGPPQGTTPKDHCQHGHQRKGPGPEEKEETGRTEGTTTTQDEGAQKTGKGYE